MLTTPEKKKVRTARLRLAQRCLISASTADPTLLTDPQWTRSLCNCTMVLERSLESDNAEGLGI